MLDPVLTKNLVLAENGIWTSPKISNVSYPKAAHEALFSVEDDSFWFQHRNNCIVAILRRFPPNQYIVDVGGGNGYVSLGIQHAGFRVILLEPGIQAVMNAHSRGIRDILHTTFQDAAFPESSVDSICLFDVLEHIEHYY